MYDAKAPSSLLALAEIRKPEVYKRVLGMADARTKNPANSEDLVTNTLMRVMDPDDLPWDPSKLPFLTHMDRSMQHTWGRQMRKAIERDELQDGPSLDEARASSTPPADEQLDERRALAVQRTLYAQLLAVADSRSPRAKECLELGTQGIWTPEQQAAALSCPVAEIYEAHRFIKRHSAQIRADWESAEQVRMAAERARHKMPGKENRP